MGIPKIGAASVLWAVVCLSVSVHGLTVTCYYSFKRDLAVGSTGADVAELQTALEEAGLLTSSTGVVPGQFGEATRAALARYQAAHNIDPANGYFGAATRAVLDTRPVTGNSRSIDFLVMCSASRLSFLRLFGHTDIEIIKAESRNCLLRYGVESENPTASGKLDHVCVVPQQKWTFDFSDQIGIDLSPIQRFCKVE